VLNVISFRIRGDFAAFRDPSVTANQTVYYIPSKSAVIGILGAIIGIKRENTLGDIYNPAYLQLLKATKIGLQVNSTPKKITFFTNHRSLKEAKTKPFKSEILENPDYTIFVVTEQPFYEKLANCLQENSFEYSPYFGHAYCPARISEFKTFEAEHHRPEDQYTSSVILDLSETYDTKFGFEPYPEGDVRIFVERHLHHFFENGKLQARVLKHWIPMQSSRLRIEDYVGGKLSSFIQPSDKEDVICIY
jgi:CRISPR-associated protein Cas5h